MNTEPKLSWKVGDLGRFDVENTRRPRFEVLGSKPKHGIAVWYGGSNRPVFVPIDTFRTRCVKNWEMDVVLPLPDWANKGACFRLDDPRAANVTQAEVVTKYHRQLSQVDVRTHTLRIRQIRFDYTSCFDEDAKLLVMVPIKIISTFGIRVMSAADHLTGKDIFGEDGDEIDQLLATLG